MTAFHGSASVLAIARTAIATNALIVCGTSRASTVAVHQAIARIFEHDFIDPQAFSVVFEHCPIITGLLADHMQLTQGQLKTRLASGVAVPSAILSSLLILNGDSLQAAAAKVPAWGSWANT